ncbi:Proton channel OtopLc [Holothuria leucospilota]|uniref:Proton channel OtopLc n=1 Tax=Holothuria leucospilota TaxID=206669 RepID=A0A9Q0YCV4_HOLLE|nr:Proton channel OtopLc [Holothuria leucospilota]
MGTLELSLRYPGGLHIAGMDHDSSFDHHLVEHDHEEEHAHDEGDIWELLSLMHSMIVVTVVIILDTSQIFLTYNKDVNAITLGHVEFIFIFLYVVSIAWMMAVIVLKHPLPPSDDVDHIDSSAGSRYLYVGLLFFGTGGCLWAIMRTATNIEQSGGPCGGKGLHAMSSILSVAFTMLQIYFFWRFSTYCIVRWKPMSKLGISHLMATNIAVVARTMVEETWGDFLKKYFKTGGYDPGYGGKGKLMAYPYTAEHTSALDFLYEPTPSYENTTYYNSTGKDYDPCTIDIKYTSDLAYATYKASVFLYSFTVEYSIIAGAMAYIMWRNIGRRIKKSEQHHVNHDWSFSFECGLLLGVLCTMCGGIVLIMNIIYLDDEAKAQESFVSYYGYRVFLNIVSSIGCIAAFAGIHRGGWQVEHSSGPAHGVDAMLLLLCVSGVFFQNFYTFVAATAQLGTEPHGGLIWVDKLTHITQTLLQSILILDAMHRKPPEDFRETRTKQILMFLLVCNITWWLLNTYELKGGYDLFSLENNYFGDTAWYVIVHFAAPLSILFRFHSTACFFEIWSFGSVSSDSPGGHSSGHSHGDHMVRVH